VSRGSGQPFYRCTGNGRWSWVRHNGGRHSRDKVAARARRRRRIVARPSRIDGNVACALGMGGFGAWEGDLPAGRSGPIGALSFGAACRRRNAPLHGGASPPAGAEQGRGEKREGGREKRTRIQIRFSQNFILKLEKLWRQKLYGI
jgi:hypothetical protein